MPKAYEDLYETDAHRRWLNEASIWCAGCQGWIPSRCQVIPQTAQHKLESHCPPVEIMK
jgi:hypothetical protein